MQDKLNSALMKRVSMTGGSFNKAGGAADGEDKAAQNPASTKSMTHLMTRRRDELEDKRKAEADKEREDKERFEKQNRMKNTVQAALKDRLKDDTEKREAAMREKKQKMREEEEKVKEMIQGAINKAR